MISVVPDAAHPRGGYAVVTLPETALSEAVAQVAIFDNYAERYLGEAGWQPTKVLFGPYDVVLENGQAQFVIGPEIVNQIEEYTTVKLMIGTAEQDLSWPDDVVPAPGAARIGGIMTATVASMPKSRLSAKLPEKEEEEKTVAPDPEPRPQVVDAIDEPEKGKRGMIMGLFALVVILAGLGYWFLTGDDGQKPIADDADLCAEESLGQIESFEEQVAALRQCGSKASADVALGLFETAAANGDATALLLFGTFYDGQITDPELEEQIGLTFEEAPATAAEYYARAVSVGSAEAAERLAALCERMSTVLTMTADTLAQGAVTDYCSK